MRKGFYALLILLAVVVLAVFLDRSVFIIKNVHVACDSAVDSAGVIRASEIRMGGRMRSLDLKKIARKVESTGEFACVSVKRVMPSTVRIEVSRRVPAAMAEAGGFVVLMDKDGCVISATKQVPDADAVYVTGLEIGAYSLGARVPADAERISAMTEIIGALNESGARELVSELNVADVKNLYFYSRTGIYVALGDAKEMSQKVNTMKYVLMDLESRGETSGKLDVSSGDKADFDAN